MSMTYDELKTAIQDYMVNDEATFVTNLPVFIRSAEEKALKRLQLNLFTKTAQGNMTSANQYLTAPTDFLAPKSIRYGYPVDGDDPAATFLRFKTLDFIQTYAPAPGTLGPPVYYAMFNLTTFILAPTPDEAYVADISYLYRPASLTAGAGGGTTWLSTNAEFVLLYGALSEAAVFMKADPAAIAEYTKAFTANLMDLKGLGEAHEVSDEYDMGPVMRQKQ